MLDECPREKTSMAGPRPKSGPPRRLAGPRPMAPPVRHRIPVADSQRDSDMPPQADLLPMPVAPQPPPPRSAPPANAGAAGNSDTQQTTERRQESDNQFVYEALEELLAGQETLEKLLRDSLLMYEFTGSSASTGDGAMPNKQSRWRHKAPIAEDPPTQTTLTPPASARSAPTPRCTKKLSSSKVTHASVVNSHHRELKSNQADMQKMPLHKPIDVDEYNPTTLSFNEKILPNALATATAGNGLLESCDENEKAWEPSKYQNDSESNLGVPADGSKKDTSDMLMVEEKQSKEVEEDKEVEDEDGGVQTKNFRFSVMTQGDDTSKENYDSTIHWRNMISKKADKKKKSQNRSKTSIGSGGQGEVRENRLITFVKGPIYENAGITLVVINAIFIGWQVEHMAQTNTFLPIRMPMELIFATLFLLEFIGKAYAWKRDLFNRNADHDDVYWNCFDLIVVSFMWLEIAMELDIIPASKTKGVSILRILRILRLVRVVKVMRTLKFFRELRLMILAISRGSLCLIWVVGVLNTAFYIFGVSLTQGANELCPGANPVADSDLDKLCHHFGTLPRSILSLYAAMSGGISWIELFYALYPLGYMYIMIFLFYTLFSIFAVTNIITGIFVDSAVQSSTSDQASVIEAEMQKLERYVEDIHSVFTDLDADDSGTVAATEFEQVVKCEKMAAYFKALGLDITDVRSLFLLMDKDGTGAIDIQEFLVGCMRLRGEAKSLDLAKLAMQTEMQTELMMKSLHDMRCLLQQSLQRQ